MLGDIGLGVESDDAFVFCPTKVVPIRVPAGSGQQAQGGDNEKVWHVSCGKVAEWVAATKSQVNVDDVGPAIIGDHHINVDGAVDAQCGIECYGNILKSGV